MPTYPTRATAVDSQALGDTYAHFDLIQAKKAYRRSVQIFQLTDGPTRPCCKVAVKKLMSLLRLLADVGDVGGPMSTEVEDKSLSCGLCGVPGGSKCAKCNTIYCCREHQVSHYPLHKHQCQH